MYGSERLKTFLERISVRKNARRSPTHPNRVKFTRFLRAYSDVMPR